MSVYGAERVFSIAYLLRAPLFCVLSSCSTTNIQEHPRCRTSMAAFVPRAPHIGPIPGRQPALLQLPPLAFVPPGFQMPPHVMDHPSPAIMATLNPFNRNVVRRLERFVHDPRHNFYQQRHQNKVLHLWNVSLCVCALVYMCSCVCMCSCVSVLLCICALMCLCSLVSVLSCVFALVCLYCRCTLRVGN
jgi:hypothetical protein